MFISIFQYFEQIQTSSRCIFTLLFYVGFVGSFAIQIIDYISMLGHIEGDMGHGRKINCWDFCKTHV